MAFHEGLSPPLHIRNMAQHVHGPHGQPLSIARHEEPDAEHTEGKGGKEQHAQKEIDGFEHDEKHARQQPEPKVAEDVGHHKENDRRRSAFGSNLRRERHDAVRLAAHQSAGRGIVECKGRHRNLIEPEEIGSTLQVSPSLSDNHPPRSGVEEIEHRPQGHDGKKPIAGMGQATPHLGKVELRHHDRQHDQTENEKTVLVFLLHSFASRFFGMEKRSFSPSSRFS